MKNSATRLSFYVSVSQIFSDATLADLLYLLEETSVKRYGLPFFGVPYDAMGFVTGKEFADDEFSDNDLQLMEQIAVKSTKDLIRLSDLSVLIADDERKLQRYYAHQEFITQHHSF